MLQNADDFDKIIIQFLYQISKIIPQKTKRFSKKDEDECRLCWNTPSNHSVFFHPLSLSPAPTHPSPHIHNFITCIIPTIWPTSCILSSSPPQNTLERCSDYPTPSLPSPHLIYSNIPRPFHPLRFL
jgi:hypothetical protein